MQNILYDISITLTHHVVCTASCVSTSFLSSLIASYIIIKRCIFMRRSNRTEDFFNTHLAIEDSKSKKKIKSKDTFLFSGVYFNNRIAPYWHGMHIVSTCGDLLKSFPTKHYWYPCESSIAQNSLSDICCFSLSMPTTSHCSKRRESNTWGNVGENNPDKLWRPRVNRSATCTKYCTFSRKVTCYFMGSQAAQLHAVTSGQGKINLKIIVMQKMI